MIIINTTTWNKSRFGGLIADVPVGKIPLKWKSEDGSGKINELILPLCNKKYWKPSNGKIVEMTSQEKVDKDQELANITAQAEADSKDVIKFPAQLKAVALALGKAQGLTKAQIKILVEAELA